MLERVPAAGRAALDLDQRPILVFWETTKACGLACRHCRASAISQPLRGELTTAHACGVQKLDPAGKRAHSATSLASDELRMEGVRLGEK